MSEPTATTRTAVVPDDFIGSKYGRMFADLPVHDCPDDALISLGAPGSRIDATDGLDDGDPQANPYIPAGWPIFGQFIAHDITADRSLLQHHAALRDLHNFRTPALNLESLYSNGPTGDPFMFDRDDPALFLLGRDDTDAPNDEPRNVQGRALIGDPRNDVHLIISQMHVAFLKFHNAAVGWLRAKGTPADQVYTEAQRLVRWHYQWIAVHEFLPLTVGQATVADVLTNGRRFFHFGVTPFVPVEFSDGAYRAGHSQIRTAYQINDQFRANIFPDLAGFRPVPHVHDIDWRYFFAVAAAQTPQPSRRIDARVAHPLVNLPDDVVGADVVGEARSLAYRDLQRARALDMPSGETVAKALGVPVLTSAEVGLADVGWDGDTPLWYYVLKEAEVQQSGVSLGAMGGRIVAEVLIGLLDGDPTSYRNASAPWQPELPGAQPGDFTMADLLRFAGVV